MAASSGGQSEDSGNEKPENLHDTENNESYAPSCEETGSSSLKNDTDIFEVEVTKREEGLQIHVFCKKRPGLLETLVAAVEGIGLILLKANISCHSHIILDAFGVQERGELVDAPTLKNFLLDIINTET